MDGYEEAAEKAQEELEWNTFEQLIEYGVDNNPRLSFLYWLGENIHKDQFQTYLNAWLETKEGKEWFEARLEKLIDDSMNQEPEIEDLGGDR